MVRRLIGPCLAGSLAFAGCIEPSAQPEAAPDPLPAELPVFPPPPDTLVATADTWYADCGGGLVFAMDELLPGIAEGMSHQKIPYGRTSPDEWRDCSGTFLRFSSYLGSACPAGIEHLAAPPGIGDYVRGGDNQPGLDARARSSRDLARWYFEQERFVPVWYDTSEPSTALSASLESLVYLVKPGAVLWFARHRPREAHGVDQLFAHNRRDTQIVHVGTVVGVTLDDDGQLESYSMYHAGNGTRAAKVTDAHRIGGAGGGPPFGNGGEFLVGIGTLLPLALPPRSSGSADQMLDEDLQAEGDEDEPAADLEP